MPEEYIWNSLSIYNIRYLFSTNGLHSVFHHFTDNFLWVKFDKAKASSVFGLVHRQINLSNLWTATKYSTQIQQKKMYTEITHRQNSIAFKFIISTLNLSYQLQCVKMLVLLCENFGFTVHILHKKLRIFNPVLLSFISYRHASRLTI